MHASDCSRRDPHPGRCHDYPCSPSPFHWRRRAVQRISRPREQRGRDSCGCLWRSLSLAMAAQCNFRIAASPTRVLHVAMQTTRRSRDNVGKNAWCTCVITPVVLPRRVFASSPHFSAFSRSPYTLWHRELRRLLNLVLELRMTLLTFRLTF